MMATAAEKDAGTRASSQAAFSVDVGPDGVAVVTLDVPGAPVNTLSTELGQQIGVLWPQLLNDSNVKAVVFTSGKKDNFIAGADISLIRHIHSASDGTKLAREVQLMFEQMEASRKPIIAAIHGACLGGGMELALACHYRVASQDRKTRLGLPEIMLGLIPGGGGTQRLPRLIGVQAALDLVLTGKELNAPRALKAGMVDEAVPRAILLPVARQRAAEFAGGRPLPKRGAAALVDKLKKGKADQKVLTALALEQNFVGRKLLFSQAEKLAQKKARGNYPAVEKALEAVRYGLEHGLEKGLEREAALFGELSVTGQSKQLINIFFSQTAAKKDTGVDDAAVQARPLQQVGILGAGLMGSGIAYVTSALAGLPVRLREKDLQGVGRGLASVRQLLDERVKRKSITRIERDELMNRVSGTVDYSGFKNCDVVIEAVFEDLALKHQVIRDVEAVVKPSCILASNTSTLPISRLAEASIRPELVVGMHYFSPVNKMPLLEVIRGKQTSDLAIATVVALGKAQGKTVIVVNDGPGFYTSRILAPYVNEACWLLAEGGDIEQIDEAMVNWGFPVGPLMLLDEVGIDVAHKAAKTMREAFGERMVQPDGMNKVTEDNRLGRKNGRGFYVYKAEGAHQKERNKGDKDVDITVYDLSPHGRKRVSLAADEIQQRLSLQFCNEAALCLQEGIVRSPRDGDIGAIFGLGFAPFRGGPFRWVDTLGAEEVVRRMRTFEQRFGRRFTPAPILVDMAGKGQRFYPM
jgi:3-hydroxyacyl-CoA dehydrogenase/enoyl-CoA hydratase/3-hydroxybutyryl-CoA epimerase